MTTKLEQELENVVQILGEMAEISKSVTESEDEDMWTYGYSTGARSQCEEAIYLIKLALKNAT